MFKYKSIKENNTFYNKFNNNLDKKNVFFLKNCDIFIFLYNIPCTISIILKQVFSK